MIRSTMRAGFACFALLVSACGRPAEAPPAAPAPASQPAEAAIAVEDPHFLATPGQVAAGYVTIRNGADADQLIGAATPRGVVELHDHVMDGAMMSMRRVERFEIPAGGELTLTRGGKHLMLIGLTGGLTAGETVPVTLTFERAGAVKVDFAVREPTSP